MHVAVIRRSSLSLVDENIEREWKDTRWPGHTAVLQGVHLFIRVAHSSHLHGDKLVWPGRL